jgi:hypothetical protein
MELLVLVVCYKSAFQHLRPLIPALTSKSVILFKVLSFFFTFEKLCHQAVGGFRLEIFAIEFIKIADLSMPCNLPPSFLF